MMRFFAICATIALMAQASAVAETRRFEIGGRTFSITLAPNWLPMEGLEDTDTAGLELEDCGSLIFILQDSNVDAISLAVFRDLVKPRPVQIEQVSFGTILTASSENRTDMIADCGKECSLRISLDLTAKCVAQKDVTLAELRKCLETASLRTDMQE
ncbi:hypothetical protein [Aestuariivirga sp.]|uniref:hypothetical protein n=1 Tax=Aestuariivirga sp. TaxID=2650926 RepID=UPI0039E4B692